MKLKTKGDRLNWTPLSEAKPVLLNEDTLKGKKLSARDLKIRKSVSNKNYILIP